MKKTITILSLLFTVCGFTQSTIHTSNIEEFLGEWYGDTYFYGSADSYSIISEHKATKLSIQRNGNQLMAIYNRTYYTDVLAKKFCDVDETSSDTIYFKYIESESAWTDGCESYITIDNSRLWIQNEKDISVTYTRLKPGYYKMLLSLNDWSVGCTTDSVVRCGGAGVLARFVANDLGITELGSGRNYVYDWIGERFVDQKDPSNFITILGDTTLVLTSGEAQTEAYLVKSQEGGDLSVFMGKWNSLTNSSKFIEVTRDSLRTNMLDSTDVMYTVNQDSKKLIIGSYNLLKVSSYLFLLLERNKLTDNGFGGFYYTRAKVPVKFAALNGELVDLATGERYSKVTSIADVQASNEPQLMANPVIGNVLSVSNINDFEYTIYNTSATQVQTGRSVAGDIALGNITPGYYILRANSAQKSFVFKFMITE